MSTIVKLLGMRDVLDNPTTLVKPTSDLATKGLGIEDTICGIELEIEYADGLDYSKQHFRRDTDGSLRNNGYEFISHPLRLDTLLSALKGFIENNEGQFTPECYSDRTSTHVHVNVQSCTLDNIKSLVLYYSLVENVLFKYVGNYRQENIYCVPLNETLILQNISDTVNKITRNGARAWQKYTALNLIPIITYGTVEFRHMHGTNDFEKLSKWIETVAYLVYRAKTTTLKDCIEGIQKVDQEPERLFKHLLPLFDYGEYKDLFHAGVINTKYLISSEVKSVKKKEDALDSVIVDELMNMPPVVRGRLPPVRQPAIREWVEAPPPQLQGFVGGGRGLPVYRDPFNNRDPLANANAEALNAWHQDQALQALLNHRQELVGRVRAEQVIHEAQRGIDNQF